MTIRHSVTVAAADNPAFEVSKNAWNAAHLLGALVFDDANGVITHSPTAGTENDLSPTNLSACSYLRVTPTGTPKIHKITSIATPVHGRILIFENASTDYLIILENGSTGGTAANGFDFPESLLLVPGDFVTLIYNTSISRWRLLALNAAYYMDYNLGGVRISEELMGRALTTVNGQCGQGLVQTASGSGAQVASQSQAGFPLMAGILGLATGTASNGYAVLGTYGSAMEFSRGNCLAVVRTDVGATLSDGTNTFRYTAGLQTDNSGESNHGAYWEYDSTVSGDWRVVTANSTTRTKATVTGQTVAINTQYNLLVWCSGTNPWTRADYAIGTGSVYSVYATGITTNLPTTSAQGIVGTKIVKSLGATSRIPRCDSIGMFYKLPR